MAEAQITTSAERAGGRRLVSGILWNGLGRGLPLLLALVITPFLVGALGVERWGLFTLALALIGIFGVFDLGLGMALTRGVSEKLGAGAVEEARAMIGATLLALLGVSSIIAAGLFLTMPWLVGHFLNVPDSLQREAIIAFQLLAAGAPLVVLNAALWGVLSAWQRFRIANLVNIPLNTFYYLGPLLVLAAVQRHCLCRHRASRCTGTWPAGATLWPNAPIAAPRFMDEPFRRADATVALRRSFHYRRDADAFSGGILRNAA